MSLHCYVQTKLKRFLPAKYCVDERKSELAVEIQKRHKTHSGKPALEVQRAYLRHVKAWKVMELVNVMVVTCCKCGCAIACCCCYCCLSLHTDLRVAVLPCGTADEQ